MNKNDKNHRRSPVNELETELRTSHEILKRLSDGVIRTDLDGLVTFWNEGAERIFGYSGKEMVGKPVSKLWFEHDLPRLAGIINQLKRGRDLHDQKVTLRTKSSEAVEILLSLLPIKNGLGEVVELVGFSKDISSEVAAQRALEESERILSTLMGNLPGMAYRCENDEQWTMRFVSQGCLPLTGYQPKEILNNSKISYADLIHPDDHQMVQDQVASSLKVNKPFELTYRILCKDRSEKWVWEKGAGAKQADGGLVIEGFINDITAQVHAQLELEKMSKFPLENPNPVLRISFTGSVLYANQPAGDLLAMYGVQIGRNMPAHWKEAIVSAVSLNKSITLDEDIHEQPFIFDITPVAGMNYVNVYGRNITSERIAQQETQAYMNLLDAIMEDSPFAMFLTDPQGTLVRTNRSLREILDVSEERIIGEYNLLKDQNLIDQGVMPQVEGVLKEQKPARFIVEWKTDKSGIAGISGTEHLWLDAALFPICDEGGKTRNIVCQWMDITDRIQAHQQVQDSQREYRSVVEDSPVLMERFLPDGTITFANISFCQFLNVRNDGMVGGNIYDKYDPAQQKIIKDYLLTFTPEKPVNKNETRVKRFDGQQRWIRWTDRALFDDRNELVGYQSFGEDITEQKEFELALKESQQHYSSVVEDAPLLIDRYLPDGTITFANRATNQFFFGREEGAVGKSIFRDLSETEEKRSREYLKSFTKKNAVQNNELWGPRFDGEERLIRWTDHALFDENGTLTGFQAFGIDITEQSYAEQKLVESERRYQSVVEDVPVMIIRYLPDGAITFTNSHYRQYFTGKTGNLPWSNIYDRYSVEEQHAIQKELSVLSRKNPILQKESLYENWKGQNRWLRWNDVALFDDEGTLVGYQAFGEDIHEQYLAEQKLKDSERRLSALMGNLPGIAYRADAIGRFKMRFISQGCRKLTGYETQGLVENPSQSFEKIMHPEDLEGVIASIRDAVKKRGTFEFSYRIITKQGSIKWVLEKGGTVVDDSGEPLYIEGFISDISERVLAEQALQDSETRFRELFERMNSAVLVYETKRDGNDFIIKDINAAGERIGQVKRKDVIGRNVVDVFPGVVEMGLVDGFKDVWKTGNPKSISSAYYKDENLSLWLEYSIYKLPSGEIVAVFDDITERKIAEMALAESEARFRAFMDNFPANAYIKDESLRHVFVNRRTCEFAGITQEEYIGKKTKETYPSEIAEELEELDQSVLDEQILIERVGYYPSPTGELRFLRDIKFPIEGLHGEKLVGGIALDLTAQKEAEEKTLQKARFEEILAQVSTEFLELDAENIDQGINSALEKLAHFLNIDYIAVGFLDENRRINTSHMWVRKKIRGLRKTYSFDEFPWLCSTFAQGNTIIWSDKYKLPNSLTKSEYAMFTLSKVRAFLSLPVHISDVVEGGLVFADTKNAKIFTSDMVESLRLFAQVISNALALRNAELELRDSEMRYRSVVEGSPVLICRCNREGEILFANQAYCEYVGAPLEKLIGQNITTFTPPAIRKDIKQRLRSLSAENPSYSIESQLLHSGGEDRWIHWTVRGLLDEKGRISTIQSFGIDITDRREAADLIQASELRFKSLFTQMATGFALLEVINNRSGKPIDMGFVQVNPAFERITGLADKKIRGKPISQVLPGFSSKWMQQYIDVAMRDKSLEIRDFNERLGIFTEIRAFSPRAGQCAILLSDITEQESLFKQVEYERDRAQNYLDVVQSMIIALDKEGIITLANPMACSVLGYNENELIGQNWFDACLPKESIEGVKNVFRNMIMGKIELSEYYENPVLTKSGKQPIIAWHNTNLLNDQGEIIGILSSGEDITERLAAQKRMETLLDISSTLISKSYGENILQIVADKILQKITPAQNISIWIYDDQNDQLKLQAISGILDENLLGLTVESSAGVVGHVAMTRKAILVNNAQQNRIFTNMMGFVDEMDTIQCMISTPLLIQDRLLGAICLDNFESPDAFDNNDLNLVESIANQLAGIIENTVLFQEVQHNREELRALSNRLLEVHEEERRSIALDLHDHFGQILSMFKIILRPEALIGHPEDEQRARLAEVSAIVDELIAAAEDLSLRLRPSILDDLGLVSAFDWHIKRFSRQTHIQVRRKIDIKKGMRFSEEVEITLYRVLEESLTNALQHGTPSLIDVDLHLEHENIVLRISDNGTGFDLNEVEDTDYSHTGLTGMQERVRLLNGSFELDSTRQKGTTIQAVIPIHNHERYMENDL